jgi:hypothetical protein
MLLSAVSVWVVVQPSSEVPEGLMNYPVDLHNSRYMGPLLELSILNMQLVNTVQYITVQYTTIQCNTNI